MKRHAVTVLGVLFLAQAAAAQFTQQGSKLLDSTAIGAIVQGQSVAISADGSTAVVGASNDNAAAGATWIYTRSGGAWTQQGNKLVGAGAVGAAAQGTAVAISGDGNTVITGGNTDNAGAGAMWVFTRSGGVWTQQGSKLVGADAAGSPKLGTSVAISTDGNTAIAGGPSDHSGLGAAFVFTRSAGVWTQQGSKLVGTGAVLAATQGHSVAISGDGNTALLGGYGDNNSNGAVWVFARSAGVWTQQGSKLVGTGAVGIAYQGTSVALSSDGSTAIEGGYQDGTSDGAAWVFARSAGVWAQQGSKLIGTGANSGPEQGWSVALSADGNTALVGGPTDYPTGATWVFTRSGTAWSQLGNPLVGTGSSGNAEQGWSVAISADGGTAIVGGPRDNSFVGAAWIFAKPTFDVWVPVASHNGGRNNSQWRSDLGLLNTGSVTANVQIKFYGSVAVSNTTYVSARSQSILTDVVGQVGGSNSGALEILSDQPLKVTARSYNLVSASAACYPNGTQGQDYPAVVGSDGLSATQSAYLPGLSENPTTRCNIGLVNTGSGSASVLVELFDGAGNKLTDYTVALNPGDWKQETQPFFNKAGQTAMLRGYAKITVQSGSGVFGFASVVDGSTNDPTTVAMQP